ncbi:nitrate- and nitrite sensing domain-containing protein [Micromonospora sp. DT233]|uniref:sensor histidine kinase n=1 Tax=Micromonospora sp. DT233 TaxID=3393432 RepID=UPI003CF8D982
MTTTPPPTAPEARVPQPGTADVRRHHRPTDRTNRLWSVRTQLVAPILIATVGLLVLGTLQTRTALAATADAERARVLAGTATATVRLVHELERELAETVALRQRGGASGRELVNAQRQRVDTAVQRYGGARDDARRAAPALVGPLDGADGQLAQLDEARESALGPRPADQLYVTLVETLLAVADALPAQLRDTDLANAAREVAAVAAQEHFAALERDLLRAIFSRGALEPGELARVAQLRGGQEQRQAEFSRIASPDSSAIYNRLLDGQDVATARRLRDGALNAEQNPEALVTDGDAWYVAQSGVIRRYNLVGRGLSEQLDRQAAELAGDARRDAGLSAGVTVAVAVLAFVAAGLLAVRTSRRLRRLRAAALTMAHRELPERITAISAGGGPGRPLGAADAQADEEGSALALTAGIARGRDEIAQVADAFDTVNRAALRLAGQQAELRVDMTRMAEALARRIRTLITRQLRLLDDFERDETDPDALARLFALDHLAARLRRNGENLLVLAGGEPGRGQHGAHLIADVVTAAAAEIEDYTRVESDLPPVAVDAMVVGNLVHLLAELLENATAYSPPHAPVRVDGRRTLDGLLLRVHDRGIGISASRLAEINERLRTPGTLSSAAAGSMGLHVVAHLAARHRIRVALFSSGAGTMATVELPESALTPTERVVSRAGAAPAVRPAERASVPATPQRPSMTGTWFSPTRTSAAAPPAWPPTPVAGELTAGPEPAHSPHSPHSPTVTLPVLGARAQSGPAAPAGLPVGGGAAWNVGPTWSDGAAWRTRTGPAATAGGGAAGGAAGQYGTPGTPPGAARQHGTPPGAARQHGTPGTPPGQATPAHGVSNGAGAGHGTSAYATPSGGAAGGSAAGRAAGGGALPQRVRGSQLAPSLPDAPPAARQSDDLLDPELVRARLSALAEGVATAMRRGQQSDLTRRTT